MGPARLDVLNTEGPGRTLRTNPSATDHLTLVCEDHTGDPHTPELNALSEFMLPGAFLWPVKCDAHISYGVS